MSSAEKFDKSAESLEKLIRYEFKDRNNLLLALTHSSYANEIKSRGLKHNERIEFLGDAVLNIIISENIFTSLPEYSEGELTKIRASIVCESSLMMCANTINLGEQLLLGKGEELTGGRTRSSILCDAFEALIGAIYVDGGLESTRRFVLKHMSEIIKDSIEGTIAKDFKTQFQEIIQKDSDKKITYEIVNEKGPDHNKQFIARVSVDSQLLGEGEGKSKKEAEQNAAREAINNIKLRNERGEKH